LRSGGPDNVTVVVADVIDLDYGQSHPIVAGAASADDDDDAPPPNTAAGRAAAMRPPRATPKRVVPQVEEAPTKKTRHRMWWAALALGLIVVVAVAAFVGRALIRNNYYVGADGERVTVLRGVPGSVLGYSLQEANLVGCVTDTGSLTLMSPTDSPNGCTILQVDDLQPSAREQVRAGLPSGKLDDVRNQMARLADNDLLPVCESQPATTTTTPVPVPSPTPEPPPATTPAPPATPETAVPPTPTPTPTTTQVPGQNCRTAS
jgi:protein phosphatase